MHIPDGYLSPQTYLPLYAAMIPLWRTAARKVQGTLRSRQVPLLALGAAFSFVVMMFNIPAPGGSSGHAVGGALVAILLGPWAACICLTLAVVIQALLFGDGGCTALAANCFTMAVVLPFSASAVYRFICGKRGAGSRRQTVAAFAAGYLSLNLSALYCAFLLGIQPLIASAPDGRPLYAPYPLSVSVPVMAGQHLLFFGFLEAAITALVVRYLQKADPALLNATAPAPAASPAEGKLWRGLALLALFTPLGVILPAAFHAGGAWGEWSGVELKSMLGYLPAGMDAVSAWKAPLQQYSLAGFSGGTGTQAVSYLVCALLGSAAAAACARFFARLSGSAKGR